MLLKFEGTTVKNSEIYRRTLKFSVMRLVRTVLCLVLLAVLPLAAFVATGMAGLDETVQLAATGIAFIIALIFFYVVAHYGGYLLTAGQVAMITEGVATGQLPEDTYEAGKRAVKSRFATASVYYGLWSITKAITNEISAGMNAIARGIDGDNQNGAASVIVGIISAVVSVVLEYLNYCSLGWVFLHGEQSAFKSTCDGAVVYFQNWKTLMKNSAKVIAITLVSLTLIGGAFFGIAYLVLGSIEPLTAVLSQIDATATLEDGTAVPAGTSLIVLCAVIALVLWSGIHGAFVKPYILVSVMRRYIEAGRADTPQVDVYEKLSGMSKGFKKALDRAEGGSLGCVAASGQVTKKDPKGGRAIGTPSRCPNVLLPPFGSLVTGDGAAGAQEPLQKGELVPAELVEALDLGPARPLEQHEAHRDRGSLDRV